MTPEQLILVCAGLLAVSFLYSCVGHAGASGYIAVMTLAGLPPAFIKPTALILNIFVACLSSWQFYRAGHFRWSLFWPFALLSIPFAFLGGYLNLPAHIFKILVGVVLLFSAVRFLSRQIPEDEPREPRLAATLATGGALGFLSGVTGTGGGIFLTPLLIFMKWARTKTASATSALFILVNSIAGLAGNVSGTNSVPPRIAPLVVTVVIGGAAGSYLGSRKLSPATVKKLLACVLIVAGFKLIFA
jgi:uncharacterized membrane protein YfcA